MGKIEVDEIDRDEIKPSSEIPQDAAQHDLPLCRNGLITAVDAVRGTGSVIGLLREHLHLRASSRLVFSEYANCYFLQVDDRDRYQNPRVGMTDAVSTMPFRSHQILKQEMSSWNASDLAQVVDADGLKALIELGLVSFAALTP